MVMVVMGDTCIHTIISYYVDYLAEVSVFIQVEEQSQKQVALLSYRDNKVREEEDPHLVLYLYAYLVIIYSSIRAIDHTPR